MRQLDNTETTQLWTHNKEPSWELPDYVFKICRVFFTSAFFNPWLIISRLKLDTSNSVMGVLFEKHWVKLKSNFRRSSGVFFKWQNFRIYEFLTSFSISDYYSKQFISKQCNFLYPYQSSKAYHSSFWFSYGCGQDLP